LPRIIKVSGDRGSREGNVADSTPRDTTAVQLDDEYALGLSARFEGRPEWMLPSVHMIATAVERESQRRWLNDVLRTLPEHTARRTVSRLEAEENFLATYNELAVASVLMGSGRQLLYEPELGGRTPDFALAADGDKALVLVEVSTKFRRPAQLAAEQRWKELRMRVERIPVPIGLFVRGSDLRDPEPPDSATAKRLAADLSEALSSGPLPRYGQGVVLGDYLFAAAAPVPEAHVVLATPASTGTYDADLVLDAVRAKASRYAQIAEAHDASLVVILAAELRSPLTLDLLRTSLRGTQAVTMSLDLFSPGPVRSRTVQMRQRDEAALFHPCVAAVGWLETGISAPGTLTLFPVASARRWVGFVESDVLRVEQLG
jgi:hypothetical protein